LAFSNAMLPRKERVEIIICVCFSPKRGEEEGGGGKRGREWPWYELIRMNAVPLGGGRKKGSGRHAFARQVTFFAGEEKGKRREGKTARRADRCVPGVRKEGRGKVGKKMPRSAGDFFLEGGRGEKESLN